MKRTRALAGIIIVAWASIAQAKTVADVADHLAGRLRDGGFNRVEAARIAEFFAPAAIAGKEPKPMPLTTLYRDYRANEVGADTKYKGKTLYVSGKIGTITKDALGGSVLSFSMDQWQIERVAARMAARQPVERGDFIAAAPVAKVVGDLKRGQEVSLLCVGAGMMLTTPHLRECLVIEF